MLCAHSACCTVPSAYCRLVCAVQCVAVAMHNAQCKLCTLRGHTAYCSARMHPAHCARGRSDCYPCGNVTDLGIGYAMDLSNAPPKNTTSLASASVDGEGLDFCPVILLKETSFFCPLFSCLDANCTVGQIPLFLFHWSSLRCRTLSKQMLGFATSPQSSSFGCQCPDIVHTVPEAGSICVHVSCSDALGSWC